MITKQEIFEGLYGAWRLLLGDRGAIALFDNSVAGFWKSFFAAIFVVSILLVISIVVAPTAVVVPILLLIIVGFYLAVTTVGAITPLVVVLLVVHDAFITFLFCYGGGLRVEVLRCALFCSVCDVQF